VAADGTATSVVEHAFSGSVATAPALVGNELLILNSGGTPEQGALLACNVVTGEVRRLFSLAGSFPGQEVAQGPIAANDTHAFMFAPPSTFGGPHRILRTSWR
jgi:hypothetical protein